MSLSFYQTISKSINNVVNNALSNNNNLFLNKSKESFNNLLSDAILDKNIETKSINSRNNFFNTMFITLYSFENYKNPKSDEVIESSDFVKSLSDCSEHWLKANLKPTNLEFSKPTLNANSVIFGSNPEETLRTYRKKVGVYDPINIRPTYISDESVLAIKNKKANITYMVEPSELVTNINEKPCLYENFLVRKQKRYKFRKSIAPNKFTLSRKVIRDINSSLKPNSPKVEELLKEVKARLILGRDNHISMTSDHTSPTRKYKMFKLNKKKTDVNNLNVNRRMLRTRRTLVLPAHVNVTAVTNSFDVIHSWFIPGLGLKMDCIPGRATHHTFYIDNVGFYYGQCAEVCGRYHHHMPIRICALPFDHFLLW
jgi:heme/copper-type cytochrome/quinol oxidase subunit 2